VNGFTQSFRRSNQSNLLNLGAQAWVKVRRLLPYLPAIKAHGGNRNLRPRGYQYTMYGVRHAPDVYEDCPPPRSAMKGNRHQGE